MADLIAQGSEPQHRWRRTLPDARPCVLGRAAGLWSASWDARISRQHATVCWESGRLHVEKLPDARNPVFFCGRRADRFRVAPGEHFVIGATTFTLADERVTVSLDVPRPVTEQAFSSRYLQSVSYRNADQRIEVLSRLPEVISGAGDDSEYVVRLVNLLLTGIPRASAVALVTLLGEDDPSSPVEVLHWDRRTLSGEDFRPSERLIRQAVTSGTSLVHVWDRSASCGGGAFTHREDVDWAFCTPVSGVACRNWAIYVAGRFARQDESHSFHPQDLRDELKFTELAASVLGSLREVRLLERRQAGLSQFFSPVVLEALTGRDPEEVLTPREAELAVLFCDLRGFSKSSERYVGDLLSLLHRVSRALGVTTRHILGQGGVVGDFHGDAAMGFWGWPLPQEDAPLRACWAALEIRSEFEQAASRGEHPLSDFRLGIGIASGPAVAGKIGTVDQVKVTAFGPVVNLAARLEDMTKLLRAPILLDEATANSVRRSPVALGGRVRRVARVRPPGLAAPLVVSELLAPQSLDPVLSDQHVAAYEAALEALLAGDWQRAFVLLHQVPAEDRVKDFLTVFIAQHNRTPPDGWDGVIALPAP